MGFAILMSFMSALLLIEARSTRERHPQTRRHASGELSSRSGHDPPLRGPATVTQFVVRHTLYQTCPRRRSRVTRHPRGSLRTSALLTRRPPHWSDAEGFRPRGGSPAGAGGRREGSWGVGYGRLVRALGPRAAMPSLLALRARRPDR